MSAPTGKLKLDSRAAELKETLLRRKDKEGTPTSVKETIKSGFAPHSMPQEISQTQVAASDNDIAALIADISGTSSGGPSTIPAVSSVPAYGKAAASANQPSLINHPKQNPIRTASMGPNGYQRALHPKNTNTANMEHRNLSPPGKLAGLGSENRIPLTNSNMSSRDEGEISSSPIETQEGMHPPLSNSAPRGMMPIEAPQARGNLHNPSTTRKAENIDSMMIDSSTEGRQARDNPHNPSTISKPENIDRMMIDSPIAVPIRANVVTTPINQDDRDLQDWLLFTNYYDLKHRTQFLARRRRLAAIEAERLKLIEEDEADVAFKRQYSGAAAASGPAKSDTPLSQTAEADSSKRETATTNPPEGNEKRQMEAANSSKREHDEVDKQARPMKQTRRDDGKEDFRQNAPDHRRQRQDEPHQRLNRSLSPRRPTQRNYSPRQSPRHASPNRYDQRNYAQTSRERSPGPYGPAARAPRPQQGEHNDNAPFGRYDSYRADRDHGYGGSPTGHGHQGRFPPRERKGLELGRKGETRFFMVKSFNESNVMQCMEDGLWTTQVQNGEILTNAFNTCRNVILVFSINKSRAFQGYARMLTTPSERVPRPRWQKNIHWETSFPFRVEWFNTTNTGFSWVHHLNNSYNDDLPVLIGKDGQEIEEDCGRKLLQEMDNSADLDYDQKRGGDGKHFPPRRGGRPAPRGGGFNNDRIYVKKEED